MINVIQSIPWWVYPLTFLTLVAIKDIFFNRKHTIKHNFPVVGHLRYYLEKIGPELRQYIVSNNREELPFNRSQRSWVYASSKKENSYQGFGTDQDQQAPGFVFINPALFSYAIKPAHPNYKDPYFLPCAKVMGLHNKRKKPYRPYSIINISAMSYGSLSAKAVESMNQGAKKAGCYHNTGEGGLASHHLHGADVMLQFGTGYFGVRDEQGNFSMEKLVKAVQTNPVIKSIEVKLSQGAKPGKGGVLPAAKVTQEIASIRHIPVGKDALSPAFHSAFSNVPELVDFIESIAERTGLPVGFKSAVGKLEMWEELADLMLTTGKGPDFISIDGGEGGTGAAPPAFADHVSLPFVYAFSSVYQVFARKGLTDRIVFIASGKLGFPANALMAFSMGADIVHVAREAMMSIGCIQAQVCHTNRCPAGVATQSKWLQNGIDVTLKSERFYNYAKNFRKEVLEITHACGYEHPSQMGMTDINVSMGDNNQTATLRDNYKYDKVPVEFNGMESLIKCQYLGGPGPLKN
ncbi:MAG TPA: FMN-binding glutamate synthase family protein [Cytophagaceae bacterium]|jgi:glutamate synthase domain-containing protein 2|nr:FMN-binding glutamate synthase family protein [Cytophagaceae bacterium]